MGLAENLAKRSTCDRAQVGCVLITSDHCRVMSLGYNGGAKGLFNKCLSNDPGACCHCHAEINCLIKTDFSDKSPKIMYSTTASCFNCAVAIINASSIEEFVYLHDYRSDDGLELLKLAGISVRKYI